MSPEPLAAKQEELVRALTGQGPAPAGFDPQQISAMADSLVRKRLRTVARNWPVLAGSLGDAFFARFTAYAAATPLPGDGSPLADGHAFAQRLAERGELADEARLELLAVSLRYRFTRSGPVQRRWPVIKAAMLRHPRRLVLAFGSRWWTIPLERAAANHPSKD